MKGLGQKQAASNTGGVSTSHLPVSALFFVISGSH